MCHQVWWSQWKWWITGIKPTRSTMSPPERDPTPSTCCTPTRRFLAGKIQASVDTFAFGAYVEAVFLPPAPIRLKSSPPMMPVRCVPVDPASTPPGFLPLYLSSSPSMPKMLARDCWLSRSLWVLVYGVMMSSHSPGLSISIVPLCPPQDPEGKPKKANIRDNHDGTYLVSYVPDMTGRYTILIKYGGDEIPYSPYRIRALPTGDASKCTVTGT